MLLTKETKRNQKRKSKLLNRIIKDNKVTPIKGWKAWDKSWDKM